MRVSTTLCATSGTVSSRPSTAAAAAKAGTPGVTRVGDAEPLEPADLLGERAVDRQVAGMQPRHVELVLGARATNSASISSSDIGAVSTMRAPGGQCCEQLLRHQRAGVEADRAARDQVAAAHA